MFGLKSPSLLQFDREKVEEPLGHNLRKLYHVKQVPCDSHMREELDEVNPRELREAFLAIFQEAQAGKLLQEYRFLNDHYLILADGTQVFSSNKVYCNNCCEKRHKDDTITYHHQVLGTVIAHPDCRQVIPLCPEPITKQDGVQKNDCEQRAMNRFLEDLRQEHPKLKATIVTDALSANAPHVNRLKSQGLGFIVRVKSGSNKSLFEWVDGIELNQFEKKIGKNSYVFKYINGAPLNGSEEAPEVNYLHCEAKEMKGRQEKTLTFDWVTSHEITQENVYEIMRGARARWKVENETFNTLKNQGYQFEHNFGHGKKHLHTVFVFLMMLAFAIDQVQEAACGLFRAALEQQKTRRQLWDKVRAFFRICLLESWEELFRTLASQFKGVRLGFDTS